MVEFAMRELGILAWAISVGLAISCTRDNPSFSDGESGAGSESSGPQASGPGATASDSASGNATSSTTMDSTTDDSTTDSHDRPDVGDGSTSDGFEFCDGDVGPLVPEVFTGAMVPVPPTSNPPSYSGVGMSVLGDQLLLQECPDCDCSMGGPLFTFELGAEPSDAVAGMMLGCIEVALVDTLSDDFYDGFVVRDDNGVVFAGFDGLSPPADSLMNPLFGDIDVTFLSDTHIECGELKDDCDQSTAEPGQYALSFQNSDDTYPGEWTEELPIDGEPYVFHNRMTRYNVDSWCGLGTSWTMERLP